MKDTYFSGARGVFYSDYINDINGLLSRMIGFEIMMTSYVVAHLNIRRTIEETLGHEPESQLPTNVYLTNTLAPPNSALERNEQMTLFDFSAAITDEAYKADTWKARRPVKVIIGNPPYNAASTTPYDYSSYRTKVDGTTPLNERNSKVLGDDYVKFIHFAEKLLQNEKQGVLSFIAPHGYFDNPVFRGMRASLLRTFDKIYVLDLHGNATKKEVAPDGSKDENVFDIRQGVGIIVAVCNGGKSDWADVFHGELWGSRRNKFTALESGKVEYRQVEPIDTDMAYFVPTSAENRDVYEQGVSVGELFPHHSIGITTGRTKMAVQHTKGEMISVIKDFQSLEVEALRYKYALGKDARDWRVDYAKDDIANNDGAYVQLNAKPFDCRWTYYTSVNKGFHSYARHEIMRHLQLHYTDPRLPHDLTQNIGIIFSRQTPNLAEWDGVFITNQITEREFMEYPTCGSGFVAPLYLKPEGLETNWQPNINQKLYNRLTQNLSQKPQLIEVFDYIYALLFDPAYRAHYSEFLRRDFPRVPIINAPKENEGDFVVTTDMFHTYVTAGERLRKLHLQQTKMPATLEIEPPTADDLEIGATKYSNGVLHLNANKRISGIPENVWHYRIGGFHVLDKWFKSRKGMTITIDDFDHIAHVVGLLMETIKIQGDLKALHVSI